MVNQISLKAAQEFLTQHQQSIRSWSEFIDSKSFRKPTSIKLLRQRIVKNIEHYQTNYLFVFIVLIIYCIITSPLLLIAITVFIFMSYLISSRPPQTPIQVSGIEISTTQQYGIAALLCFPMFFFAGAGAVVFWVIGVSFFLIGLHASLHKSSEEGVESDSAPFIEDV